MNERGSKCKPKSYVGRDENTWTRLTFHGIVNDCDLGEVSVYTPSKGCVGLRVYGLHTGVRGHIANMCLGS